MEDVTILHPFPSCVYSTKPIHMKKALLPLLLLPLLISCEINQNSNMEVVYVQIKTSDWHAEVADNGTNLFYYCDVDVPQITQYAYDQGLVSTFYIWDQGQQVLPYVRHFEDANLYGWTRTFDYEYSPGALTVYATRSDFVADPPPTMNFRIVVQW